MNDGPKSSNEWIECLFTCEFIDVSDARQPFERLSYDGLHELISHWDENASVHILSDTSTRQTLMSLRMHMRLPRSTSLNPQQIREIEVIVGTLYDRYGWGARNATLQPLTFTEATRVRR